MSSRLTRMPSSKALVKDNPERSREIDAAKARPPAKSKSPVNAPGRIKSSARSTVPNGTRTVGGTATRRRVGSQSPAESPSPSNLRKANEDQSRAALHRVNRHGCACLEHQNKRTLAEP